MLTAARFRNANWLLEQCHRIWLAVGINGSWKRSAVGGEKDLAVFFIVLWSYGRKICAMDILKFQMVVHVFSGFALFKELQWVYCRLESLCKLSTANKVPSDLPTNECKSKINTVHLKTGFIWKFSQEWHLSMGYASEGSLWKKPPTVKSWNCEALDEKSCIKEFLVALLQASAASLKVTDLLFVKRQHN